MKMKKEGAMRVNNRKKENPVREKEAELLSTKNRGSAVIEITLLLPLILWFMVLLITMLLGTLQQARVHSGLMITYAGIDSYGKAEAGKQIYSETMEFCLTEGYGITSEEQQVVRNSNIEEELRRWQLVGDMVAK